MRRSHRVLKLRGGTRVAFTNTSTIPDARVIAFLRFLSREVDLDRVVVHVKRDGARRRTLGLAYDGIPGMTSLEGLQRHEWLYLITVTDADFVFAMAHESKHIERYREGIDRKVRERHGTRRGMEAACDAFGHAIEEKWNALQDHPSGG